MTKITAVACLLLMMTVCAWAKPVSVFESGGRPHVPLQYVAEWLGYQVDYTPDVHRLVLRETATQKTIEVDPALTKQEVTVNDTVLYASSLFIEKVFPGYKAQKTFLVTGPGYNAIWIVAIKGHGKLLNLPLSPSKEKTTTPLHIDALNGFAALAERHIDDVNSTDYSDSIPLHIAAMMNRTEIITLLLRHKADINKKDKKGVTPLMQAVLKEKEHAAELLLAHGAAFDDKYLVFAARSGMAKVVATLLEKGIDPNVELEHLGNPLTAAAQSGHLSVVKLLVEKGAEVNRAAKNSAYPLQEACYNGHPQVVAYLVEQGANINAAGTGWSQNTETYGDGNVVLHYNVKDLPPILAAVYGGHTNIVKDLLEIKADITAVNSDGMNAAHLAVLRTHKNDIEMLELLKANGVDMDALADKMEMKVRRSGVGICTLKGVTAMQIAVITGYKTNRLDIIRKLLDYNVNVNASDASGWTALHLFAISDCADEVGTLLLQHGASKTAKTNTGQTPYDLAVKSRTGQSRDLLKP